MQPAICDSTEQVMECSVVETQQTHLNPEEHALLKELLRPGVSIEAVIPPDATPEELWHTLDSCSRGIKLLDARGLRLKLIVGKILLLFQNKPSLYRDLGYDTFTDFMAHGVYDKLKLHRQSAWEARRDAAWPQITPDRYANKLGPKKMEIVSKIVKPTSPNAELVLQTAESMTLGEFRSYSEQRGLIAPGETVGAEFTIHTNRNLYTFFKEFFSDPDVHARLDTKEWDKILEALIQDQVVEWTHQGRAKRAAAAGAP